jgi:hypothetical protein
MRIEYTASVVKNYENRQLAEFLKLLARETEKEKSILEWR